MTDLPAGEVHVWRWRLDAPASEENARALLTRDEQARAARYHFDAPRRRFVAARAGLRRILSRYIEGINPSQLTFALGPHGKPALESPSHRWLRFSLAHTGDLALCALARDQELGVDIEPAGGSRVTSSMLGYAVRRLCSSVEQQYLAGASPEAWSRAFLTLWTCKEAIGKARGTGLKPPVPTLDPVLASSLELPESWHHRDVAHTWFVRRIEPFDETVGALAVEAPDTTREPAIALVWIDTLLGPDYQATGTR